MNDKDYAELRLALCEMLNDAQRKVTAEQADNLASLLKTASDRFVQLGENPYVHAMFVSEVED